MSDANPTPDLQQLPASDETQAPEFEEATSPSEQFLKLQIVPSIAALLPIQHVLQILTIPIEAIVPLPHMHAWVMGVYNWQGEILWMVDLSHLCGLTPWYQQAIGRSTHQAIVLRSQSPAAGSTQTKEQLLGLVVNQVEDIEWCSFNEMQALSPLEAPELIQYSQGYGSTVSGEQLAILNREVIFAAMPTA